ncbi:unnamed protein product [Blepharisma stoltei]|uniref:Uncharacterized protein n=1 Tax=Blepharisma stoltei TaxID=1481888 RepID=A0AAU9JEA4_9CILI|nr:unnamed protein product [Blepharisma stoltei]
MQAIKRILIGFSKKEFKEHCYLFGKIRKSAINAEDYEKVTNKISLNFMWKVFSLSSSAFVAVYFHPFSSLPYPIAWNGLLTLSLYRILTTEHNYKSFCMVRDISLKYNLKGNPNMLRSDVKDPYDWSFQKEELSKSFGSYKDNEIKPKKNNRKK